MSLAFQIFFLYEIKTKPCEDSFTRTLHFTGNVGLDYEQPVNTYILKLECQTDFTYYFCLLNMIGLFTIMNIFYFFIRIDKSF